MNVAWRMVAFPCDEHIATPPVFTHPAVMLPYVGTLRKRTSKASHANRHNARVSVAAAHDVNGRCFACRARLGVLTGPRPPSMLNSVSCSATLPRSPLRSIASFADSRHEKRFSNVRGNRAVMFSSGTSWPPASVRCTTRAICGGGDLLEEGVDGLPRRETREGARQIAISALEREHILVAEGRFDGSPELGPVLDHEQPGGDSSSFSQSLQDGFPKSRAPRASLDRNCADRGRGDARLDVVAVTAANAIALWTITLAADLVDEDPRFQDATLPECGATAPPNGLGCRH